MPDSPHVLDEYASRLRADLAANEKEQQRLRSALHQLEQEQEVLIKMQVTLDAGAEAVALLLQQSTVTAPAAAHDAGLVTHSATDHLLESSHLLSGHRRGRRPGERPLIDIVGTLLREQSEPRSVAEIREAVMKVRPATEQTVRNTLDRLVATSKAERTKQGRSVFYSATSSLLGSPRSPADNEITVAAGEVPS
ncbi:BlaI/MecI/CopY family transcriptional regulator [Streptomyces sp. NPDC005065]|uniref:BlaI/MecI/CopY family transcriptional regulator n=1 Tax=unclassified Streptomyces TaxID=2593676 RepID=UPI0033AB8894